MILSKAYDEIMEKIVVNDDMRCRILQNLEKQMTDEASKDKMLQVIILTNFNSVIK